jgi:hypothetical protein
MLLRNCVYAVAFFAVGYLGYQLGSGQRHPTSKQTVTLDHVQVFQTHPAALYVRTASGKEHRYGMEDWDRHWAQTFKEHPGRHWRIELTNSPECPSRYTLTTLIEQPE